MVSIKFLLIYICWKWIYRIRSVVIIRLVGLGAEQVPSPELCTLTNLNFS